jgi:hypothetical protein
MAKRYLRGKKSVLLFHEPHDFIQCPVVIFVQSYDQLLVALPVLSSSQPTHGRKRMLIHLPIL